MGVKEFREYCEQKNRLGRSEPDYVHDDLVEKIVKSPGILGFRDIEVCYVNIPVEYRSKEMGSINLVLFSKFGEVYLCEVKTSEKTSTISKSKLQLRGAADTLREKFGIYPELFRIHRTRLHGKGGMRKEKIPLMPSEISFLARNT